MRAAARHRPRVTLGQVLTAIAVSAVPLAPLMHEAGRQRSGAEAAIVLVASLIAVLLAEVLFWLVLVPSIPPMRRALIPERPIDGEGIAWLEPGREDPGITWLD